MHWKKELTRNIATIEGLREYVDLTMEEAKKLRKVQEKHPFSITRYYASLIDWQNPNDPLRKMMVPSVQELNLEGTYDTSGEKQNTKLVGLQHKYKQTVLILATNFCATYCRFCFRKRLIGLKTDEVIKSFEKAAEYIKEHETINNVLISGGDPLTLDSEVLELLLTRLAPIQHLDFVRIGSKIPVTFPQRIIHDEELTEWLRNYNQHKKRLYIVTHFNHPREITDEAKLAIAKLQDAGLIISNQTVLLKDVNDNPEILADLMKTLIQIGVLPYYVFQCRPVKRAKKMFQLPLVKAYAVVESAKRMLDGHCKRFRFVMSHRTGKVEVLGIKKDKMYLKYHQAKRPENYGKTFTRKITPTTAWLDRGLGE